MSATWAESLAGPLELEAEDAHTLTGRWRGEHVGIEQQRSGCRLAVALEAPLPPGFFLRRQRGEGVRDERGPDLVIGDAELDPLLQIQCAHPAAAIRILKEPAVKEALLAAYATSSPMVTPQEVVLTLESDSVEAIRAALGLATRLAVALRAAAGHQLESLAASSRSAKEELVYLPSQRFVKGPPMPVQADFISKRFRRRGARWFKASLLPFAVGLYAHLHGGWLAGPMLYGGFALAGFGLYWLSRGARCPTCGFIAEQVTLPWSGRLRCPNCRTQF